MKKQCIGCKREISKGQPNCPICGAPQSFIRHHRPLILMFILISATALGLSQWYINKSIQSAEREKQQLVETETLKLAQETERLKNELQNTKQELASTSQQLSQFETQQSAKTTEASELAKQLKTQLAQSQANAKKQSDRAGWLNRENRRLKAEIESLKSSQLESIANNTNNTPVTNLNTSTNNPPVQTEQQENSEEQKDKQVSPPTRT